MSESAPRSREALFRLLRELARAGTATPERLAAARESIRNGHLGPPSEALVDGEAGHAIPLFVWAASWGDVEMVKLLLELGAQVDSGEGAGGTALHAAVENGDAELVELLLAHGANPLALRGTREAVLRTAHRHGRSALFELVRRAAKDAIDRRGACHGAAAMPFERRFVLRTDRGAQDLRRTVGATRALDVLLVSCDLKTTARALGNLVEAPRREADVGARPVQDAQRLLFLYRMHGIDWTIIPFVVEATSPWNVAEVFELAAPGSGIAVLARALASATSSRVIHLRYDDYTIYSEHGGIETRRPESIDGELASLGALVPPMCVSTDGYHAQLQLHGIAASEIERADVVVLQELGDPEIKRTTALPAAAPAMVGAPTLAMPGLPPMVQAPPRAPSPAPPLVSEPPPLAVQPAPSEAAPLMREPPPLIAPSASDVSDEEPEGSAPPTASEPPVVRAPSAAPPLVREPPAMVAEPSAAEPSVTEPSLTEPEPDTAQPSATEPSMAEPSARQSEAPPLVREPPPVVATDASASSPDDDA